MFQGSRSPGNAVHLQLSPYLAGRHHFTQMSQEAKTSNICTGMNHHFPGRLSGSGIESGHYLGDAVYLLLAGQPTFNGSTNDSATQRLGQHQSVPCLSTGVGPKLVRVDRTADG